MAIRESKSTRIARIKLRRILKHHVDALRHDLGQAFDSACKPLGALPLARTPSARFVYSFTVDLGVRSKPVKGDVLLVPPNIRRPAHGHG